MTWVCWVCGFVVDPDEAERICTVGVRGPAPSRAWAWGPVPVHPDCEVYLTLPDRWSGTGHWLDRERIRA